MPSQVSDIEMENANGEDALLGSTRDGAVVRAANGVGLEPLPEIPPRSVESALRRKRSSLRRTSALRRDGVAARMLPDQEIPVGVLETAADRKARKRSHYVVYVTCFVMSIGFSIVLTGVWPYLQQVDPIASREFLGWVVAANPLGQMLASPAFGLWANKAESNRGAFILTISCFIAGNIFYAILGTFGASSKSVMIFSRFVVGVSSANIAVIRSYVAASTTLSERTTAVSFISASQAMGFIIGPAIQSAIAAAFDTFDVDETNLTLGTNSTFSEVLPPEVEERDMSVVWNMYTATGWFAALLGFVNIFLFLPCIYQEYPIAAKEAQYHRRETNGSDLSLPKPDYLMLVVVLIIVFIILAMYVLLETIMVPMTMDMYAWSDKLAITVVGIGLSIGGVLTIVMFSIVGVVSKKLDERKVVILMGLVPMTLSAFCFFPMGSTYPKMQNCTLDSLFAAPIPDNYSDETTLLPDFIIEGKESFDNQTIKLEHLTFGVLGNVTGDVFHTTELSVKMMNEDVDHITSLMPSHFTAENLSSHDTLSRRRRHATVRGSCHDLGCPQEQTWCLYTPIIERSQLGVASVIAVMGYPISFTILSSLFSKLLGPKPQGVWMGILTSTGSCSRVIGPIGVSYVYTMLGTRWTFGILFSILATSVVLASIFYRRLVPMKVTGVSDSNS
ncbi:major facilitator superfamily domain-containing protein 8-like isoform X2 [Macrobrachium nipponense]|uniref:major facilitator superfamily domain-containing protein 8-like isoform X2 n=1 Tax=Macrobrachium nipponense TaxID=159736 RepID=UPI0030C89696